MIKIIWSESFSIGVTEIDEQHKKLIGMINNLSSAGKTTTRSVIISDLLSEMANYALEHFAAEEKLMREYNYPEMDLHISHHRSFREKSADFYTATFMDVKEVPEILLEYLRSWLVEHILKVDMKMKPFFLTKGVK